MRGFKFNLLSKINPVFIAACSGMLIFGVVMTTFGSVLPDLMKTYDLDKVTSGFIASSLSIGIMVGSIFFGHLADRYGFKIILISNICFVVLGLEMLAYSNSQVLLYPAVFFIGLGGGMLNGSTGALVADISGQKKGARLSTLGVFFGVGALGMPSILAFFRDYFEVSQIIGLTGIIISTFLIFLVTIRFPSPKHSEGISWSDTKKLITSRGILLASLILLFAAAAETLLANWLSIFLFEAREFSIKNSLYYLSFYMAIFTGGRILLSFILSKYSAIKITLYFEFLAIIGCLFLFMSNPIMVTIGIVLMGLGFSPNFPVIMAYVAELFSDFSGTAFSIILSVGLVGNMAINYLMGYFSELYSAGVFPHLATIITLFIILTLLIFKKYLRKLKVEQ